MNEQKMREALERAERKLSAYVGVCKGDKELTDAVLPMIRAALAEQPAQGEAVAWYDGNTFYANTESASMCCADMSKLRPVYYAPPAPSVPERMEVRSKIRKILAHHAEFGTVAAMLHEAVVADLEAAMLADLQAEGKHPAPCARFCEAIRMQQEIDELRTRAESAESRLLALASAEPVACISPSEMLSLGKGGTAMALPGNVADADDVLLIRRPSMEKK